jgi:hypothetical protein
MNMIKNLDIARLMPTIEYSLFSAGYLNFVLRDGDTG